jgi:GNAT superfamily N-acetyltransferase
LVLDKVPIGILRYNLFRDNIPFCKMIYIWQDFQRKGYGKILLNFWEEKMKN